MIQLPKFMQKSIIIILISSSLTVLFIFSLQEGGYLEFMELGAYDWFIRIMPKLADGEPRITIIEISEDDIHSYGHWPMTDETLARAISVILKFKPRAVGLDIYRDILVPPGSEELNRVLAENPQVIGVMKFGEKGVLPPAIIDNTDQVGFNDILVDPGGVVRKALLFQDDGKKVYNSFAFQLAKLYLHAEGVIPKPDPQNPQYIRLKDTTIRPFEANDGGYVGADARGYQFLLGYKNAGHPFRSYHLMHLISGQVPREALFDKIVLIGVSAQSVKDSFFTPLSKAFEESRQVPGVVLHGFIASQLLRFALDKTPPMSTPKEIQKILWVLFWSLVGGLIGYRTHSAWRLLILMALSMVLLYFVAFVAFVYCWWIPLVPPALSLFISAGAVTAYISGMEKRERKLLMQIFSCHVSKEIAEFIWRQRDQFMNNGRLRSQKMTVTVFFSDVKGFTSVSEKMDPQELIDWLNTYMEAMTCLIMEHGGVVDNYVGDGIKADFGVPIPRKSDDEVRMDAINAIECALAMEKEMDSLNLLWQQKGLPAMSIRVGIFTGIVVAGLLGSSQRLKYTTIGDTVNIASRLESYDKEIGRNAICRILIGDTTLHYLDAQFKTERIGEVGLKGKDERITIHRVLGKDTPGVPIKMQEG